MTSRQYKQNTRITCITGRRGRNGKPVPIRSEHSPEDDFLFGRPSLRESLDRLDEEEELNL